MTIVDRILLVGASGMLGGAFQLALKSHEIVCMSARELIAEPLSIRRRIAELRPTILLNCAADTDVESAEETPSRAFLVNALLPDLLAQGCHASGVKIVQFSSTGCYGDHKVLAYDDYDALAPTTEHHRAKAAGEAAVREACREHLILRLGWLYGGAPGLRKNFVWNRIEEARTKSEFVSDPSQIGNPTHTDDVVRQTLCLLSSEICGTFNCVAVGAVSRFDYVQQIIRLAGLSTRLTPQRFERRAPVSQNEAAINQKLDELGLNIMPFWDKALTAYIQSLLSVSRI